MLVQQGPNGEARRRAAEHGGVPWLELVFRHKRMKFHRNGS